MVSSHSHIFPNQYNRLIEPFLGSGAVFFSMRPKRAILSDLNADLIESYQAIKDHSAAVQKLLEKHHKNHSKEYYYKMRASKPRTMVSKAAKFIYLNRTCWNGLYRVNLKGEFNVPVGTKTNVILDSDNFEGVASLLSNADISVCDFEVTIDQAMANDLVFIDPPYTVKHNNNGFLKYNETLFSWDDQIRLRDAIERAVARGAFVLLTNAKHKCIEELYEGIGEHLCLSRSSVISGKTSARGKYEEIIVKCY